MRSAQRLLPASQGTTVDGTCTHVSATYTFRQETKTSPILAALSALHPARHNGKATSTRRANTQHLFWLMTAPVRTLWARRRRPHPPRGPVLCQCKGWTTRHRQESTSGWRRQHAVAGAGGTGSNRQRARAAGSGGGWQGSAVWQQQAVAAGSRRRRRVARAAGSGGGGQGSVVWQETAPAEVDHAAAALARADLRVARRDLLVAQAAGSGGETGGSGTRPVRHHHTSFVCFVFSARPPSPGNGLSKAAARYRWLAGLTCPSGLPHIAGGLQLLSGQKQVKPL